MQTHEEMQQFADHPELLSDSSDLRSFARHVRSCDSCRHRLSQALKFHDRFFEPLQKEWRHLSQPEISRLQAGGYLPGEQISTTYEEWHANVCPKCRRHFSSTNVGVEGAGAHPPLWRSAGVLASLCLLSFVTYQLWNHDAGRSIPTQQPSHPTVEHKGMTEAAPPPSIERSSPTTAMTPAPGHPRSIYRGAGKTPAKGTARRVEGMITEISDRIGISLGKQDGLQKGDSVSVYSRSEPNGDPIGTVLLNRVYSDISYGEYRGDVQPTTGDIVRIV